MFKNYNLIVTEVLNPTLKKSFPGIFNFTFGILTDRNPAISFMTGIYDSNTGNITGIMGIKPVCFGYRDKITGLGVKQA